jgi:hypothetical protein
MPPRKKGIRSKPIRYSDPRLDAVARYDLEAREAVRELVFTRDRHCLLRGGAAGRCFGALYTPHHLWKGGQGGPYVASNLVTLCAWHNDWVELEPDTAKAWGLVVRNGDDLPSVWRRMQFWGLVNYWWDGTPADSPMPEMGAA